MKSPCGLKAEAPASETKVTAPRVRLIDHLDILHIGHQIVHLGLHTKYFKFQWFQAFHLRKPFNMFQVFGDLGVSLVNFRKMNLEKWRTSRTGVA